MKFALSKKLLPASSVVNKMGSEQSASNARLFQRDEPIGMLPRQKREAFKLVRPKPTVCMEVL
jgi:hypothetical protein